MMELTIVMALIALLISVASLYLSYKSEKHSQVLLESDMYEKLSKLERDLVEFGPDGTNEDMLLYENTQEQICNRYEIYCQQFLTNKLNKKTFETMYKDNVITLVENSSYNKFLFDDASGYNYCHIREVYNKFKKKSSKCILNQ